MRERTLQAIWGIVRWLAVVVGLLLTACFIDWALEKGDGTPDVVRLVLLLVQVLIGVAAGIIFALPLLRRLTDSQLSLCVEEKVPELRHRLITAIQLNEPDARTDGMSPELIAAVTRQAEVKASQLRFTAAADHSRLKRSAIIFGSMSAVAALFVLLAGSELAGVLLARQFLLEVEIPRSVRIENLNEHIYFPSGEDVELRFKVSGEFGPEDEGVLKIKQKGRPDEYYPLRAAASTHGEKGIYVARVPAGVEDFTYRARLKDGRTPREGEVRYVPRPDIVALTAWTIMPPHYGLTPAGTRYLRLFSHGEIAETLASAEALVHAEVSKQVHQAFVELLDSAGKPMSRIKMNILRRTENRDGKEIDVHCVEARFALKSRPSGYQIWVTEEWSSQEQGKRHAFTLTNMDPKKRGIRIVPESAPQVQLLPEQFPPGQLDKMTGQRDLELANVAGVPVPLGERVRIAYVCKSVFGIGEARLRYRLFRFNDEESKGDEQRIDSLKWESYPLTPFSAGLPDRPQAQPKFNFQTGALDTSRDTDQIQLFKVPSPDPNQIPDGLEGGGRFDFHTGPLRLPNGQIPQIGDHIEFFVEVSNRDPNDRKWGRSEIRTKEFKDHMAVARWVAQAVGETGRLIELQRRQSSVFGDEVYEPKTLDDMPELDVVGPDMSRQRRFRVNAQFHPATGTKVTQLNPTLTILFVPREGVTLKDVKLRYWFTQEGGKPRQVSLVLAEVFRKETGVRSIKENLITRIGKPEKPRDPDERFLEIGFNDRSGKLFPGSVFRVQFSLRNEDGSPFDPHLDHSYSYDSSLKPGRPAPARKVTMYVNDKLVWGIEPGAADRGKPAAKFGQSWLLIGPFPNPDQKGRDFAYPPEKEPVILGKEYDGLRGKVRWQPQDFVHERIDLGKHYDHHEAGVAYAVCWFFCDGQPKGILATGSDDGIKVWLNRKLVLNKPGPRDAEPRSDLTPVELQPGWNELLVKIDNRLDEWAFYLDLLDPKTNETMPNIVHRATPPK